MRYGRPIWGDTAWLIDGPGLEVKTIWGEIYRIPVTALRESDQVKFRKRLAPETAEGRVLVEKPVTENGAVFVAGDTQDRSAIPVINQGEYGQKSSDCLPSSFCNFVLWWDQQQFLETPKRGDFDEKAEWLHTRMARYCSTRNNSGTGYDDAIAGFTEYFEKNLKDVAALRIKKDLDVTPANLARYTTGCNETILSVEMHRGNRHGPHAVALVSASPDGNIVFYTWGYRFKGKMRILQERGQLKSPTHQYFPATSYAIDIENSDVPQWVKDTSFTIEPAVGSRLLIIKPYVFAEKGKATAPPDDRLMDFVIEP